MADPVTVNLPRAVGADGSPGVGVPAGGSTGQVLAKTSGADYATAWVPQSGGGVTPPFAISDTTGLQAALNNKQPLDANLTNFAAIGANDVLIYRSGGMVTTLTLGSNLSVSGGALNATGGMGGGDVFGPAANTADYVPQWNGANSKLLKDGRAIGAASSTDLIDRAAGDARYQPLDSDLTAIAALATTSFGRNALTFADGSAARTAYGLIIGTDVQAFDADLSALAALTGTNTIYYRSAADTWSPVTIGSNLTFTGGTLAATGGGGGSGDVTGPASATNNGVALFNGTTGKIIKDGPLLSTYALLASPALTGTPTAPTAATTTNTTQLATTAFVQQEIVSKANITDTINTQTGTTYTLQASDNGKVVELSNAAAITLTAPTLTTGFNCIIRQVGAGQVTVSPSSTVLRNRQSHTKLAGQWAEASIGYRGASEFVLSGDTSA